MALSTSQEHKFGIWRKRKDIHVLSKRKDILLLAKRKSVHKHFAKRKDITYILRKGKTLLFCEKERHYLIFFAKRNCTYRFTTMEVIVHEIIKKYIFDRDMCRKGRMLLDPSSRPSGSV